MHFARTVASGQAAEKIANKPELLEMDRFLRRSGIHRRLGEEVGMLPPRILEQLEWYCHGVNDGLLEVGRTLPMWAVGFQPEAWNAEAVLRSATSCLSPASPSASKKRSASSSN